MTNSPPRIVLIGCGQIATHAHLPALALLRQRGAVHLAAVCDTDARRAEAAARRFGVTAHGSDWRALAEETASDAVAICAPPGANAELAIEALGRGLHVICEKPPGRRLDQAERLAAAAAARPELVSMVAFNRRYAPLYRRVMEQARRIGPVHAFYGRFTRGALGAEPSNTLDDWITSDGSHALDLAVATIGDPDRVSVTRRAVGAGAENVWTIQLESRQGAAVLVLDFAAGRRVERFELSGPGYDAVLELPDGAEWAARGAGVERWRAADVTQSEEFCVNYGFVDEYLAFLAAVAGTGPRPAPDFAGGAEFMRLVRTVLDAEPGRVYDLARRDPDRVVAAARTRVVASQQRARPVVQIMQPPAVRDRYFAPQQLAALAERCELRLRSGEDAPDLHDVDVLVLGWGAPPLAPDLLASASRLQLVVVVGASVRSALAPEPLMERGVTLCNTAHAIAVAVAEHCLLLTLAGLRRLPEIDRRMHRGEWPPWSAGRFSAGAIVKRVRRSPLVRPFVPMLRPVGRAVLARSAASNGRAGGQALRGQTVGLIGWGHIAREFARLLRPFECRLLVASEHAPSEELAEVDGRRASLGEVLAASRVVSLHKGLTERTRGLLDADALALLAPGTVLVNTARAGLIDEAALVARARKGDIVLALDVYHTEPLPRAHPLRRLDNVILTPHWAGATPQCERRTGSAALEIVSDWMCSRPIPALDAERLSTMT